MRYSYVCKYVSGAQNESGMRGQIVQRLERDPFQLFLFLFYHGYEFFYSFSMDGNVILRLFHIMGLFFMPI